MANRANNNMKFKVGDRVRVTRLCAADDYYGIKVGDEFVIDATEYEGVYKSRGFHNSRCMWERQLELVSSNNKKTLMKTINVMMKKLLDADTQKLVKAGLINGDLELTTEGQKVLMSLAFDTHKTALVKEAEEIIKEEETKKN